jgi:hypothetical protein
MKNSSACSKYFSLWLLARTVRTFIRVNFLSLTRETYLEDERDRHEGEQHASEQVKLSLRVASVLPVSECLCG